MAKSNQSDYYDILVIGSTGMGKSTTVEKMLIANFGGVRQERSNSASQLVEPVYDHSHRKLVCEDLTMWLVSDQPSSPVQDCHDDSFLKISTRLKNLIDFRAMKNSHLEINKSRAIGMNMYENTLECELLSNEYTKVRILDVPGFFGHEACANNVDLEVRGSANTSAALNTMRKVLRIKNIHNLNFKRVIYFLPVRGVLERTSQHLIMELQIMENHFGRAIFDSMVVIATESSGAYKFASLTSIMFNDDEFAQTKHHLQDALQDVFHGEDVPEPPIEFISLFDTCEDILHKVQSAKVLKNSIVLEFKSSFCARCGLTVLEEGKNDSEASYCTSPGRPESITYDESTCHPVMVPKYSKVQRVIGGVLHLVTLRRFVGVWPKFESVDEVCIKCRQPPQTRGCMKIGTDYPGAKDGKVGHSHSAVESYEIEVEDEDYEMVYSALPNQEDGAAGIQPGLPSRGAEPIQHDHHHHNHDGKYVFKQRATSPPNYDVKC